MYQWMNDNLIKSAITKINIPIKSLAYSHTPKFSNFPRLYFQKHECNKSLKRKALVHPNPIL